MTRKQKQQQIANVSPKTIENWRKSKPQLIEALDSYIDHLEAPEEMTLEVWLDTEEKHDRINIRYVENDTTMILPYQEKYSYFKNVLRVLGSKYGIIDFKMGEEGTFDTFKVKELR